MDALYLLWHAFAAAFGAIIGSFLNVCIARLPEGRSIVHPGSTCPVCHTRLGPADLVPVLSWLALRGRCRHCGSAISPVYPVIELMTSMLAWLLFRRFVPGAEALDVQHVTAWLVYFGFASLLIVSTYTDIRYRIIPTETSLYAIPFGIVGAALLEWLVYDGWMDIGWRSAVLGTALGGGFFAAMSIAYNLLRGTVGLGWGDVRMMAMIGGFLGAFPGAWFAVLLASLAGIVLGLGHMLITRERAHLPFAPSLALGAMAYVLYGDVLLGSLYPGARLGL